MSDLKVFADSTQFYDEIEPTLLQDEATNSLVLGLAKRHATLQEQGLERPELFQSLIKEGDDGIALLRTLPRMLLLAATKGASAELIKKLSTCLAQTLPDLPGVVGPKPIALAVSEQYSQALGKGFKTEFQQGIFRLDEVIEPVRSNGALRQATREDHELVSEWLHAFDMDVFGQVQQEPAKMADMKIGEGSIYLWEDGKAVSMAASARPTINGITVNYVYTPPEHRARGYASNLVAELSQLLLNNGYTFCSLYTDLANPTSNSIYQKIGYRKVSESAEIHFIDPQ